MSLPARKKQLQRFSQYDQAVKWVAQHNDLPGNSVQELRDFQAEAQKILKSVPKR